MLSIRPLVLSCSLIAVVPGVAPADLLRDFNLVVTGDLNSSSSEVEGRTLVGGNLRGATSNYAIKLKPANQYTQVDTLVVGGNLQTNNAIKVEAGNLRLGGSVLGANPIFNGGGHKIADPSIAGIGASAAAELSTISLALKAMATDSNVTVPGSQPGPLVFNAAPGADGVAVFSISGSLFSNSKVQQIELNANGATSIVVNVSGSNITFDQGNFVGAWNGQFARSNVIWNFHEALTIDLKRNFFGALLAPTATLSNNTAIEGSVFVRNFNQNGEVHLPTYTGFLPTNASVPEPGSVVLLGLGGLGLLALRRSRRRAG